MLTCYDNGSKYVSATTRMVALSVLRAPAYHWVLQHARPVMPYWHTGESGLGHICRCSQKEDD